MRIFNNILEQHPRGPRDANKKKAILIGATGATGKHLLRQLLDNNQWDQVTCVSRRSVLDGESHDKLNEVIVDYLDNNYNNALGIVTRSNGESKEG